MKIMKNYSYRLFSFCLLTVLLFSCSDSFVDLPNPSEVSVEVFPRDLKDLEQVNNQVYGHLNSWYGFGSEMLAKTTFPNDHTTDMAYLTADFWNTIAINKYDAANTIFRTVWQGMYRAILSTNTTLDFAGRINERTKLTAEGQARVKTMMGENYFWRAYSHMLLCCYFGEGYPCNGDGGKKAVPLQSTLPQDLPTTRVPRCTVDELYAQCIKDYVKAIELLPESWPQDQLFRPTRGAAKSFLGQLYLYQGDWARCAEMLKDVIDHSGKELVPFDVYKDMFNAGAEEYNKESILELNEVADARYGMGQRHSNYIAVTFRGQNGTKQCGGWGNLFFHDANIERFGDDPRLKVCALAPGDPVTVDGFETTVMRYKDVPSKFKGWGLRKYVELTTTHANLPDNYSGINLILMRLADVYLMYAEACNKMGNDDEARKYVNLVRRRAWQDTAHDFTSTGLQLRDDIREERFRELFSEGLQHWHDVCRWRTLGEEVEKWYQTTRAGAPVINDQSYYFPIPQYEIDNNPMCLQSEGY